MEGLSREEIIREYIIHKVFFAEVEPANVNDPGIKMTPELEARKLEQYESFMRRHGMTQDLRYLDPKTERGRQYLEKLRTVKEEPKQADFSERELKLEAIKWCDHYTAKVGREFQWDYVTKSLYRNLLFYFCNDSRCVWPLGKGLLLSGKTGVGKTLPMKIFRRFVREVCPENIKAFDLKHCRDVYDSFVLKQQVSDLAKISKQAALSTSLPKGIDEYIQGNWCFDDLGDEEREYKYFGNTICVMEQVINGRYERFTSGRGFTFITTNLSRDELIERYGRRVFDRLKEMTTPIDIIGDSRR